MVTTLRESPRRRIPLDDTTAWFNVITWARTAGRGLLYVDDNQALLELTARAFSRVGARCSVAANHEDGVRALAEDPEIQVAIVDYDMPDGDVRELVQRLHAVRPDLIIVGTSTADRRLEFVRRGVHRFVAKPWRIADLVLAVEC
jgi:DNA-binding NtrC family response regulator